MNEAIIKKIEEVVPVPDRMTARHSRQSKTDLHQFPEFAALMKFALDAARQTMEVLEHEPRVGRHFRYPSHSRPGPEVPPNPRPCAIVMRV